MSAASYHKDLFAILGLNEKATPDELRKAYLHLAVTYHPDRNPGDPEAEERFKDISQAYAILSDPAARAKYERLRPQKTAPSRPKTRPAEGSASAKPGPTAGAKARPGSATSSGPGAGPKGQASSATGKTARPENSAKGEAGAAASGPKNFEHSNKNTDPSSTQPNGKNEAADSDFDEVLSGFFKSDKGRETLRDLEGELGRAGIKFKAEDFAEWVRQKQKPPRQTKEANQRSFMEKLSAWIPGAEARARKKAERYDIAYQITLSPQVAATGATVEISYQQDNAERRLEIKIPAGVKDGAKLRLAGQGRLKPDQSRGDLLLSLQVSQPLTLNDLWK